MLTAPVGRALCLAALAAGVFAGRSRPAEACSPWPPAPLTAFPGAGPTPVSPQSSIFIGTSGGPPAGLVVEVNGVPAAGSVAPERLGPGLGGAWWRIGGVALVPGASHVVRGVERGALRELSRFTAAATYDKTPGTAARATRLRLWRVRYPLNQIAAGGCVFSEYEGYLDIAYEPGSVPGTPDAELLTVVTLSPKTGGMAQTFVTPGRERVPLARSEGGQEVPEGRLPSPAQSFWKPELAPDREYCATVTLYGRNDLAALPPVSEPICAPVMNLAWGAPTPDAGPTAAPPDAGPPSSADAGLDATAPADAITAAGDAPAAATSDGGNAATLASDGGCSCALGSTPRPAGSLLAALLGAAVLAAGRARRRR